MTTENRAEGPDAAAARFARQLETIRLALSSDYRDPAAPGMVMGCEACRSAGPAATFRLTPDGLIVCTNPECETTFGRWAG